jgi:hypothetical protein
MSARKPFFGTHTMPSADHHYAVPISREFISLLLSIYLVYPDWIPHIVDGPELNKAA